MLRPAQRCAVCLAIPTETRATILRNATEQYWRNRFLSKIFIRAMAIAGASHPPSRCCRSAGTGTLNAATPKSHFIGTIRVLIEINTLIVPIKWLLGVAAFNVPVPADRQQRLGG